MVVSRTAAVMAAGISCGLAAGFLAVWAVRRPRRKGGRVYIQGHWHHEMCLVARYGGPGVNWRPWCTCTWSRTGVRPDSPRIPRA